MRTLSTTFSYTCNGGELKEHETELDGSQNIEDIKTEILDKENDRLETEGGDEGGETYTLEMIEIDSVVTSEYSNADLQNVFKFAEAWSECDQDEDVVEAAIECDIQGADIDEAYNGAHDSDADFAEQICTDCGDIPKDLPRYIYIDWDRTARDIMMDYSEHNGHYFRNL